MIFFKFLLHKYLYKDNQLIRMLTNLAKILIFQPQIQILQFDFVNQIKIENKDLKKM
jgi:hypothetical protein